MVDEGIRDMLEKLNKYKDPKGEAEWLLSAVREGLIDGRYYIGISLDCGCFLGQHIIRNYTEQDLAERYNTSFDDLQNIEIDEILSDEEVGFESDEWSPVEMLFKKIHEGHIPSTNIYSAAVDAALVEFLAG